MNFRHALMACASTAMLSLVAASAAAAQSADAQNLAAGSTQAEQSEATEVDEVVVTGLRRSLNSAQDRKRNSDQVIDSIQAEDIGRLPDTNIVESLQRIAGVQIQRRYGEGGADVAIRGRQATSAVAIRGLTQVRYLVDGRDTYSAAGGRNLNIEAFPPEILAGIDVYKNPSAEMIEGGIGGLINMRTRLPFDQAWRLVHATGRLNYYDLSEKLGGSASALYSNRWSTPYGEMGFLINPVYSNSSYRQDSLLVQPYYDIKPGTFPGAPAGARAPTGFQIYDETGERDRLSLATAFQWQASDDVLLTLQALHAQYYYDRQGRYYYNNLQGEDPIPTPGAVFEYAPDGRVISGSYNNMLFNSGRSDQELDSYDANYTANVAWQVTNNLSVKFDAQYMSSRYDADEGSLSLSQFDGVYDRSSGNPVYEVPSRSPNKSIVDFNLRGAPTWTVRDERFISDPNTYHYQSLGDYRTRNESDQTAFRFDFKYDVHSSILEYVSGGLRYADSNITMRQMSDSLYTFTSGNTRNWWDNWWTPNGNYYIPYRANLAHLAVNGPSSNFFNGRTVSSLIYGSLPRGGSVSDQVSNAFALFGATRRDGFNPAEINEQSEESVTAYVNSKLTFVLAGLPVDAFLGLRAVETSTTSKGFMFPTYLSIDPTNPANLTAISAERTYTSILPSVNVRMALTDTLVARFAYAEAMARPDFWQMGTNVYLNNPLVLDQVTRRPSGSSGNPFLEPLKANQYDLSLEWYFAKAGSLTGSVFYKDVEGFLASGVLVRRFNDIDYDISTTVNSKSGVIQGYEIAYQQFYDFLPGLLSGLGFQANYTYVDSDVENPFATPGNKAPTSVPLEKLSEHSMNLVGLYEKGSFSARLAYNWRSKYLNTTVGSGATGLPQYQAPYASLDASVSYNINSRVSVTLEGVNITDRMGQTYIGSDTEPLQAALNDRRLSLIVRAYY